MLSFNFLITQKLHGVRVIGEAGVFITSAVLQIAGMNVNNYSNWSDVFMVTCGI